jgi:subtilisin family serine protease
MFKRSTLNLISLESRDLLSYAGFDALEVNQNQYNEGHVLVRWLSTPTTDDIVTSYESLGPDLYVAYLAQGVSVAQGIAHLQSQIGVDFAQPDYVVGVTRTTNDPLVASQWALNNTGQNGGTVDADIDAFEAWDIATGTRATIVAVIDTGVDFTHPDLAANMWINSGEIPGNGIDDDGNGFADDVYGWNFVGNNGNVMDDNGHGTHVAGIIGAVGNNGIGVAGVNWNTRIMALKFLDANGSGYLSNAVRALNYAVQMGARISNNSYGGGGYDQFMAAAIANARNAGHIFVAAAGNSSQNIDVNPAYPASYNSDNVIAVASTDRNDRLSSFSNYGVNTVDLAAPGSSILSTLPGGRYGTYSGTSMAAPQVAGAMALIWDRNPTWTYRQVIDAVLNNVDRLSSLNGLVATGGRLNIHKALAASSTPADTTGAFVTDAVFSGINGGINRLRVTFNEAINPSTFTAADVRLTGPSGATIALSGVSVVANTGNRTFDITFANQTTGGTYRVAIGPDIRDLAGNLMDQNRNGIRGESGDVFIATTTVAGTTVFSNYTAQTIRDLATTTSTINVTSGGTIQDLDIRIDIQHTYVSDLRISLRGPDGTTVVLVNRRGGSGDHFSNTFFDDSASQAITSAAAPFRGTFRPEQLLAAFNGKSITGTWTLIVEDLARLDTGRLVSWSVIARVGANSSRSWIEMIEEADVQSSPAQGSIPQQSPAGNFAFASGIPSQGQLSAAVPPAPRMWEGLAWSVPSPAPVFQTSINNGTGSSSGSSSSSSSTRSENFVGNRSSSRIDLTGLFPRITPPSTGDVIWGESLSVEDDSTSEVEAEEITESI